MCTKPSSGCCFGLILGQLSPPNVEVWGLRRQKIFGGRIYRESEEKRDPDYAEVNSVRGFSENCPPQGPICPPPKSPEFRDPSAGRKLHGQLPLHQTYDSVKFPRGRRIPELRTFGRWTDWALGWTVFRKTADRIHLRIIWISLLLRFPVDSVAKFGHSPTAA